MLAIVAALAVASPFAVTYFGADPVPVDRTNTAGMTSVEEISLADLPTYALDIATSGLADLGIKLPTIDPALFPDPETGRTAPAPPREPSAPPTRESSAPPRGSLPDTEVVRTPAPRTVNPVPSSKITPAKPAPAKTAPTKTTPTKTTSTRTAPTRRSPPKSTPAKDAPAKRSPTNKKPPTKTPTAKRSPKTVAPGSDTAARMPVVSPRMADGRPVGAAVQRIANNGKPLKMVALTWDKPIDATPYLRVQDKTGRWGPWTELDTVDSAGSPGPGERRRQKYVGGTEPLWVGDAKAAEVLLTRSRRAIPAAETQSGLLTQLGIGSSDSIIATLVDTVLSAVRATVITPRGLLSIGSSVLTSLAGGPKVISRAQWGADERIRCSRPRYSPQLKGAVVHHTAGSNDYTPQQSAEIVRGIYAYHAQVLNWCDIGYNVLVDKYGQIFEGAYGGLGRNVEGNHTGGFNRSTLGLAMIGDLNEAAPTAQMVSATGRFLRWRLGLARLSPVGTSALEARYFADSKFAAGSVADVPTIAAHSDLNHTDCPGLYGDEALTSIRAIAAGGTPIVPVRPSPTRAAPTPVVAPAPVPTAPSAR